MNVQRVLEMELDTHARVVSLACSNGSNWMNRPWGGRTTRLEVPHMK